MSCVYVNPETGQFWVIDYRIYDPDADGKSKIDHVLEMLQSLISSLLVNSSSRVLLVSNSPRLSLPTLLNLTLPLVSDNLRFNT